MRAKSSDNFEAREEGGVSLVVGLVFGSLLITWENNFPLTRDTACAPYSLRFDARRFLSLGRWHRIFSYHATKPIGITTEKLALTIEG